jgi:hypothetical protein
LLLVVPETGELPVNPETVLVHLLSCSVVLMVCLAGVELIPGVIVPEPETLQFAVWCVAAPAVAPLTRMPTGVAATASNRVNPSLFLIWPALLWSFTTDPVVSPLGRCNE